MHRLFTDKLPAKYLIIGSQRDVHGSFGHINTETHSFKSICESAHIRIVVP